VNEGRASELGVLLQSRAKFPVIFQREKGLEALFRIRSSLAESGPSAPGLYFAISIGEMNRFAQSVFVFLPAGEFQE